MTFNKKLILSLIIAILIGNKAFALNQTIDTAQTNLKEEFFVQTIGSGFTGLFTELTVKVSNISALYPSNITVKEWNDSSYRYSNYVRQISPCSYTTTPECSGHSCNGSEWEDSTTYTIKLDFSCRSFSFTETNYYAIGFHGGNTGNDFRVVGSPTDVYANGTLKTGVTSMIADCYYGGNPTWGGWAYNQISTQTSVCYADTGVADAYFIIGEPDTTPPTVDYSISPSSPNGTNGYYITIPTIELSSSDSDLDKIEYSWSSSSGPWTTYSTQLHPSEGTTTLYYKASDTIGNVSDVESKQIKLDLTLPDVNYSLQPQNPDGLNSWYKTTPLISLSSTAVDLDKIVYYWGSNSANLKTYTTSLEFEDGTKTLHFKSKDIAGNYSAEKSVTLKTDTKNPKVENYSAWYSEEHKHIDIKWEIEGNEDIHNVKIYKGTKESIKLGEEKKIAVLDNERKFFDENIRFDETYYYRIEVVDQAGNCDHSDYMEVTTPKLKGFEALVNNISGNNNNNINPNSPIQLQAEFRANTEIAKEETKNLINSENKPVETTDVSINSTKPAFNFWYILGATIIILVFMIIISTIIKNIKSDEK